jgi:DNA-binding CsgD family transcriptional regulator
MSLRAKDLSRVLDTIVMMNEAPYVAFERTMLTAAKQLLSCESVSYNEHHLTRGEELRCLVEPSYIERGPASHLYLRHLGQHPLLAACAAGRVRGGDCVAVSDLATRPAFRRMPIYADYFRHRGVEDQLGAVVRARDERTLMVVFSRSSRGFNDRDRGVLGLLLPHLRHAVHRQRRLAALAATRALPSPAVVSPRAWESLTERERDVVACLRMAATDQRIARTLLISPRTVGKHLENVYRKLSLSGRMELLSILGPAGAPGVGEGNAHLAVAAGARVG